MDTKRASDPTVFIVDDDSAVLDSLLLLLRLKGIAAQGFESAGDFLAGLQPDWHGCLLLDLRMPGKPGFELQDELKARAVALPIIVITAHGDIAAARRAFQAGAIDFLEKPLDEKALLSAIATALEQDRRRRSDDEAAAALDERMARLSAREREVMWLVGEGRANHEIAGTLGLSPRTVEVYKARMMEKLRLRGLPELLQLLGNARRDRRDAG